MRRRGVSLIELVVAMFIGSFVSLIVYTMFSTSMNLSWLLRGEEDATRRLELVHLHLQREINETDLASATLVGTGPAGMRTVAPTTLVALAYPLARDPQSHAFLTDPTTGEPVWKVVRLYWQRPGENVLRMATVPLAGALPLPASEVERLCAATPGEVLADDVTSLNFAVEGVDVVNPPIASGGNWTPTSQKPGLLHAWIALEYTDRRGRKGLYSMDVTFLARNSFYTGWPKVYPTPTTTPTPPAQEPVVPNDWST